MMNRSELVRADVAAIQAFLDEFEPTGNGEPRSVAINRTGEFVMLRNFPLPSAFRPDWIDILLVVADYPARPPVGLYMLNRNNDAPIAQLQRIFNVFRDRAFYTAPAIPGYTWLCYHYSGDSWRFNARNPTSGDNLRKFLVSFFSACERDASR